MRHCHAFQIVVFTSSASPYTRLFRGAVDVSLTDFSDRGTSRLRRVSSLILTQFSLILASAKVLSCLIIIISIITIISSGLSLCFYSASTLHIGYGSQYYLTTTIYVCVYGSAPIFIVQRFNLTVMLTSRSLNLPFVAPHTAEG